MSDNPEDYELFHYGVKGMKWGVRNKEKSSYRSRYSEIRNRELLRKVVKSKNGDSVEISEDKTWVTGAALGAISDKSKKLTLDSRMFTFSVNGKKSEMLNLLE